MDSPLWKDFKPFEEYGKSTLLIDDTDAEISKAKQILERDMQVIVPPKYRCKVEYRCKLPTPKGIARGICWYYHSSNISNRKQGIDKLGGYRVV